ncbi:MAG: tetratricopeptide repeat protein [Chloroflexota bacterium]
MPKTTRSHVAADRPLALQIGARLREERTRAGLTQAALAEGRYTKAYVSALENGLAKPSMAALNYFAGRLGVPITTLLAQRDMAWARIEADLRLASGDWLVAFDAYTTLLATEGGGNRGELLRGLAEASARLERGEDAVRAASESAAIFRAQGRPADAAWAMYWQASGLYELEQSDEARRILRGMLDGVASGQPLEPDLHVRTLIALGMIESRDDEPESALAVLESARSLVDGLDDRRRAAFLFSLALSYRELGDFEAAISTATQSLAHFRAASDELEAASIQNELALVYLGMGNLERARDHASHAKAAFQDLGNQRWLAHVADTEAQIELASGDVDLAIDRAASAVGLARVAGDRKAEISALVSLARARRATGDLPAATATLAEAATLARTHTRRALLQAVLGEFADVLAEQGDLSRAFAVSQEALAAGRHR